MANASEPILLAVLALATVSDLATRLIPNSLSLGGSACLLAVAVLEGGCASGAVALAGGCGAAAAPALIHLARPQAMGGGDVKLSFAIGCGIGPAGLVAVAFASLLAVCGALVRVPIKGWEELRGEVPFAPYLAAGALAALCVA